MSTSKSSLDREGLPRDPIHVTIISMGTKSQVPHLPVLSEHPIAVSMYEWA